MRIPWHKAIARFAVFREREREELRMPWEGSVYHPLCDWLRFPLRNDLYYPLCIFPISKQILHTMSYVGDAPRHRARYAENVWIGYNLISKAVVVPSRSPPIEMGINLS